MEPITTASSSASSSENVSLLSPSESLEDLQNMENQSTELTRDCESLEEHLETFVISFDKLYELKLAEYEEESSNESAKKTTKTAEYFTPILGLVGESAKSIIEPICKYTGSRVHRNKAIKVSSLFEKIESDERRKIFVKTGCDIFKSFESIFMHISDTSGTKSLAMQKLAKDARDRSINFLYKSVKNNINIELEHFIQKGVILGKSKNNGLRAYVTPEKLKKYPRMPKAGFLVKFHNQTLSTSDLYKYAGLKMETVFYQHKEANYYYNNRNIFGYRLLFHWEQKNVKKFIQNYECSDKIDDYKYILTDEKLKAESETILNKIIKNDSKLQNERIEAGVEAAAEGVVKIQEHQETVQTTLNQSAQKLSSILNNQNQQLQSHLKTQKHLEEVKSYLINNNIQQTWRPFWDMREVMKTFSGRQDQQQEMHQYIQKGPVVIWGLIGIGKSELVIKFVHEYYTPNKHTVLYINARTDDNLNKSFRDLYVRLGFRLKDKEDGLEKSLHLIVQQIYEFLREKLVLLIFDEAENFNSIKNFLPPTLEDEMSILITSTSSKWESDRYEFHKIELKEFSDDDAQEFIKTYLNELKPTEIEKLANIAHRFPLALQQIISLINEEDRKLKIVDPQNRYQISEFFDEFEKEPTEILNSEVFHQCGYEYGKTTLKIMRLTVEKFRASQDELSEQALNIINILSFFSSDKIPTKLLLQFMKNERELGSIVELITNYNIARQKNIQIGFESISFLTVLGLIQLVIRLDLIGTINEERIIQTALMSIKNYANQNEENAEFCHPHILSVWKYACKYDKLIEEHILNNPTEMNATSDFHILVKGSRYQIIERIINHIQKTSPDKLKLLMSSCDKDRRTPLSCAIYNNDQRIAQLLIAKGANVNGYINWAPLHLAVQFDHANIVECLLDNGALITATRNYKYTPLHFAARSNNKEIVELLLMKGQNQNVNAEAKNNYTPLHFAAKLGFEEVVKVLLTHKQIKVDAKTKYGMTALAFAVKQGNISIVQALLNKGANVNIPNQDAFKPVHFAALYNRIEILKLLLEVKDINVNCKTNYGNAPLHLATEKNFIDVVKILLAKGANVNIENKNKKLSYRTALHLAVEKELKDIVGILIENGADVNIKNENEWSSVHLAADIGNTDILKLLIKETTVNINEKTPYGNTPLHLGAEKGNLGVVEVLLNKGVEVNLQNKDGFTALHEAVTNRHLEIVKRLYQTKSIDLDVKTYQGQTALDLANDKEYSEISEFLRIGKDIKFAKTSRKLVQAQTVDF